MRTLLGAAPVAAAYLYGFSLLAAHGFSYPEAFAAGVALCLPLAVVAGTIAGRVGR